MNNHQYYRYELELFFLGLIIFEIIADIFAKEFSLNSKYWLFGLAIICYVIANASWLISLQHNSELARMANLFSVSTGLIAAIIGIFVYGENLLAVHYI